MKIIIYATGVVLLMFLAAELTKFIYPVPHIVWQIIIWCACGLIICIAAIGFFLAMEFNKLFTGRPRNKAIIWIRQQLCRHKGYSWVKMMSDKPGCRMYECDHCYKKLYFEDL